METPEVIVENTETDVLWENEVNANTVMVAAALATAAIFLYLCAGL